MGVFLWLVSPEIVHYFYNLKSIFKNIKLPHCVDKIILPNSTFLTIWSELLRLTLTKNYYHYTTYNFPISSHVKGENVQVVIQRKCHGLSIRYLGTCNSLNIFSKDWLDELRLHILCLFDTEIVFQIINN
jgi:hypothetical protein